ncbi:hypothetical protein [Enemella sp. A6]|uniref:hypothetical protein n=1 Tax=Enemella sp. A6 TaxID=3440152 RepID=UPI003EB7C427
MHPPSGPPAQPPHQPPHHPPHERPSGAPPHRGYPPHGPAFHALAPAPAEGRPQRRVWPIVLLGVGLVVAAVTLPGLLLLLSSPQPRLAVLAPDEATYRLQVDGEDVDSFTGGKPRRFVEGTAGTHTITLIGPGSTVDYDVDLKRGKNYLIPTDGQCYVTFNIRDYVYGLGPMLGNARAEVVERHRVDGPLAISNDVHITGADLPEEIAGTRKQVLFIADVPCDSLNRSDESLVELSNLELLILQR